MTIQKCFVLTLTFLHTDMLHLLNSETAWPWALTCVFVNEWKPSLFLIVNMHRVEQSISIGCSNWFLWVLCCILLVTLVLLLIYCYLLFIINVLWIWYQCVFNVCILFSLGKVYINMNVINYVCKYIYYTLLLSWSVGICNILENSYI